MVVGCLVCHIDLPFGMHESLLPSNRRSTWWHCHSYVFSCNRHHSGVCLTSGKKRGRHLKRRQWAMRSYSNHSSKRGPEGLLTLCWNNHLFLSCKINSSGASHLCLINPFPFYSTFPKFFSPSKIDARYINGLPLLLLCSSSTVRYSWIFVVNKTTPISLSFSTSIQNEIPKANSIWLVTDS
jgi:hypothetical protein